MNLEFRAKALEDLSYWKQVDKNKIKRIRNILASICEDPYQGIGKPEPLKYQMTGCWSRRIDREHRIIYKVDNNKIVVFQCRYHY